MPLPSPLDQALAKSAAGMAMAGVAWVGMSTPHYLERHASRAAADARVVLSRFSAGVILGFGFNHLLKDALEDLQAQVFGTPVVLVISSSVFVGMNFLESLIEACAVHVPMAIQALVQREKTRGGQAAGVGEEEEEEEDGTDSVFAAAPKNQMALYRARFQEDYRESESALVVRSELSPREAMQAPERRTLVHSGSVYAFFIALALHSFFEVSAISMTSDLTLFALAVVAICFHKFLAGVALATRAISAGIVPPKLGSHVIRIGFAASNLIGVVAGSVSEAASPSVHGAVSAIGVGTVLYVGVELLGDTPSCASTSDSPSSPPAQSLSPTSPAASPSSLERHLSAPLALNQGPNFLGLRSSLALVGGFVSATALSFMDG